MARTLKGIRFDKGVFYFDVQELARGGVPVMQVYVADSQTPNGLRRVLKNGSISKTLTKKFAMDYDHIHSFLYNWFGYHLQWASSNDICIPEFFQIRELLYKAKINHPNEFDITNYGFFSNGMTNEADREPSRLLYKKLCEQFAHNNFGGDLEELYNICKKEIFIKETNITNDDYFLLTEFVDEWQIKDYVNDITLVLKMIYQLREIISHGTISNMIGYTTRAIRTIREKKPDYTYSTKGAIQDIMKTIAHDFYDTVDTNEELEKVNKILKHNQTLRNLNFEDEQFIVVVPTTYEELVKEGTSQRNCAAEHEFHNYLRNGKRKIVFIRKKDDINHSYITCDMGARNHQIEQFLYACNNRVTDNAALEFKKKYQEYLDTLEDEYPDEIQWTTVDYNRLRKLEFYRL